MRLTNERRRTSWIWCHTPDGHIDAQRADVSVMKHLPATNLLLLDLLPLFMSLCAVRADADPSSYWFHMAAEFMLQAVIECGLDIEGFLTIGPGMRMIEAEAFAWGCSENTTFDNDADINPAMFWDYDNDGPITQWTEIREEYRAEVSLSIITHQRMLMTAVEVTFGRGSARPFDLSPKGSPNRNLQQDHDQLSFQT